MIEQIFETGSGSVDGSVPMSYGIEMLWHEGEAEHRKSIEGTDVNLILQDAMKFIINHYKKENIQL